MATAMSRYASRCSPTCRYSIPENSTLIRRRFSPSCRLSCCCVGIAEHIQRPLLSCLTSR
ncbi:hypothetical protein B0H19DRAFT_1154635, partial [Mycena capillaripes]